MNEKMKKWTSLLLVAMLGTMASACDFKHRDTADNPPAQEQEPPDYTKDTYAFTTVYLNGIEKTLQQYVKDEPSANGKIVYDVYSNIGNKNYVKMDISTDVDLVGYIHYYNNANKTETNAEKFFVEAGSSEFITFLDAFRVGARGAFEKTITTISFQNVDSTKEGKFTFKSLGISDRSINTREEMLISDGSTLLGTSPYYGGCIMRLEKLEEDVYEYMDADGNICIDRDVDPDSVYKVSNENVNLVNIMDLGREVQPSYYSGVGEENGYKPDYDPEDKDSYYQGLSDKPIYNPIQCGDYGGHTPQIIDYNYQSDRLYVKMKAQEWFFFTNIQANGYIEVTYSFDKSGAVVVDNSYVDFSQFINEMDVQMHTQETPATYFAYPLNYFYCETKQGEIFDKTVGEQNGRTYGRTSKRDTLSGSDGYFYALNGKNVTNGWCAFVNENKFGVGIYLPGADKYIASRARISNNYFSEPHNSLYYKEFFQFEESQIVPSYASGNYSYINPALQRRMVQFIPLEYTYALYIGDTDEMGEVFSGLKKNNVVNNDHLSDEATMGWPKK